MPYQVTINCINDINSSEVVQAQLADSSIDIFTGMTFADEEQAAKSVQNSTGYKGSTLVNSYTNNLTTLGYENIKSPEQITFFPNDYQGKTALKAAIDNYNNKMEAAGQSSKVINYNDSAEELTKTLTQLTGMLSAVLMAFVAISLVVSSIMIGIITYISVLERRREIGILRAIGARRRDISRVFNAETTIIGLFAGLIGIVFAELICVPLGAIIKSVASIDTNIVNLTPSSIVILVALSVGLTLLAGLSPSKRAARQNPVEAINS